MARNFINVMQEAHWTMKLENTNRGKPKSIKTRRLKTTNKLKIVKNSQNKSHITQRGTTTEKTTGCSETKKARKQLDSMFNKPRK